MTALRALPLVLVATVACANGARDEDRSAPAEAPSPDLAPTSDTAPPQFTAVALPDDFPAEFPIPPGSVPVAVEVEPKATGTLASIELVDRTGLEETVAWYRDALADMGWTVGETARDSSVAALQADRGESYVELRARPSRAGPADDDRPGPWLYIEAEIWTVSP